MKNLRMNHQKYLHKCYKSILKLNYQIKNLSKIGGKNMFTFKDINVYEYMYQDVMIGLNKKFWKDFDYHRDKMFKVFSKIKNIKWIEIDTDFYNRITNFNLDSEKNLLESSRYSHPINNKCYPNPNSDECYECFKYWCCDCGKGSNSMYFSCNGKKCTRFFESIPKIFEIKSIAKRIYIFKNDNVGYSLDKIILKDKAMYGY